METAIHVTEHLSVPELEAHAAFIVSSVKLEIEGLTDILKGFRGPHARAVTIGLMAGTIERAPASLGDRIIAADEQIVSSLESLHGALTEQLPRVRDALNALRRLQPN